MATALPPNTHIGGYHHLPKLWFYPDGNPSTVEPSDGQVFFVWDTNKVHPKECWQWSANRQQWLDVTASGSYPLSMDDSFDLAEEFERMVELGKQSKKCECGSDSVGSPRHSSYCPKWSADP